MDSLSSSALRSWDEGLNMLPLGIGKIGRVVPSHASERTSKSRLILFQTVSRRLILGNLLAALGLLGSQRRRGQKEGRGIGTASLALPLSLKG